MEQPNLLDDYTTISVIGKGSYAKVVLVRKKTSGQLYALKSMKKKYIQKKNQVQRIMLERDILTEINHPFLIRIHSAFQNEKKIFLALEYCPGGQLFGLLSKKKRLRQNQARFYAAQMILALEYLHSKNIIYRDLKPENVLIQADGYIKFTDFGLSKSNITGDYDTFSVCGTPQYLAPEVLRKQGHGKAVDWWCLGSIIYELIHGLPAFYSKNRNQLFQNIKNTEPFMNKQWSRNIRDLLEKLFNKNPIERLKHVQNLKQHPWFAVLDWQKLKQRQIKPPFVPVLQTQSDVSNFDKKFTSCSIESQNSSYHDTHKFQGFSYQKSKSPSSPRQLNDLQTEQKGDDYGQIELTKEEEQKALQKK